MNTSERATSADLRVAVVGCGDVAEVHFAAIADAPGVQLVGVCDRNPGRASIAAERFGVPAFSDIADLLAEHHLDVVHVCTPHDEHEPVARVALQHGVHVLLEKPLAQSVAAGQQLVALANESRATLGVCFQNRYNPTSVALKTALVSGDYGKVLGARAQVMWTRTAQYYRDRPWRGTWAGSGGGLLMNQAIHTIDLVQWFLGDVEVVHGDTSTLLFADAIEVEDTAVGVFEHTSGVRTNFYATLTHFEHAPVFIEITCERAVLVLNGDLVVQFPDGTRDVLAERDEPATTRTYWGASHERLIADFYRAVRAREPFWIDAAEAAKSLAIAQAFYRDHENRWTKKLDQEMT